MTALASWQNFYLLIGTAAATLTGLMFVAVTFGASLVTKETAQTARAFLDPTFLHFVQVLLLSCVLTMPGIGPTVVGVLIVCAGLVRLAGLVWIFRRIHETHKKTGDIELSDWMTSIVLPLCCHALSLASGVGVLMHVDAALTGLAVSMLALVAIGIQSAWELLVWMAVTVSERRRATPPQS